MVVKRRSSQKVIVDEEWLSEKEMREDYGWSAYFPYSLEFAWTQTTLLKSVSTCIVLTVYVTDSTAYNRVIYHWCSQDQDCWSEGILHEKRKDPCEDIQSDRAHWFFKLFKSIFLWSDMVYTHTHTLYIETKVFPLRICSAGKTSTMAWRSSTLWSRRKELGNKSLARRRSKEKRRDWRLGPQINECLDALINLRFAFCF